MIVLFLFGLCVGSFLNVLIERLPRAKSRGWGVVGGRSRCPGCGHELAGRDLVPLLSFVLLKGRCRYCQQKISWQYPLVELATGFLFVSSMFVETGHAPSLPVLISTVFLVPIFVIDLRRGIIPDKIVFPAIGLVAGSRLLVAGWRIFSLYRNLKGDIGGLGPYLLQTDFFRQHVWLELRPLLWTLLGSVFLFFCFFVLHHLFSGRALGGGDVKLALLVGLITGWPNMIVAVVSSFLTGALVSVILMSVGKKRFGETVPFGPFLVIGTYVALFWGDKILRYLRFLF